LEQSDSTDYGQSFFCSGLKIKKQVEKQSEKWLKPRRKSKRSKTVLEQSDSTVFAKCFFVAASTLLRKIFFRENFLEDFFLIFNKPRNFFLFFVSI